MNICVIGLGYVGLTTGAVLADLGNDVLCVDIDARKIANLLQGIMPFYEPGLEEIVMRNLSDGRLMATTDLGKGVKHAGIIFICVGTPPKQTGETDLSQVESVARNIAKHIDSYKIIVNKSTVPIGTGDFVRRIIEEERTINVEFDVVSNPEFLREGSAVRDSFEPDRVIIGAPNRDVAVKLLDLYATLGCPMLITDVYSAEMIKYASNAFLATKISFINAVANMCEQVGADVTVVAKGMGYDRRIGRDFLNAGLGFGGSCFPKDVESLIHTSESFGCDFRILKEVMAVNRDRTPHLVGKMIEVMGNLSNKVIGIWGLAFKPDTDDIRESKPIEIIKKLIAHNAKIKVYDPQAIENTRTILPDIEYCSSAYEVAQDADAIILATEWREFQLLNMERVRDSMRTPILFDGRNLYNPETKARLGFTYYSVGRGFKNSPAS
jgi:UDPglucose 6-dehydrogenase